MNPTNITDVSESLMCSNCGACASICPTEAISFKFTNIGRYPAIVDEQKCISCKLCRKVCPSLDLQDTHSTFKDPFVGDVREVYVGKSTYEELFLNAQSGGAVTTILKYLFEQKEIQAALVVEQKFGNPPVIYPKIVTSIHQLKATQKSCYTPVSLLSALRDMKDYENIAVVGLPCHLEGVELLNRLKRFTNIKFRLGLICDKTLCNTIQNVFIKISNIPPNYFLVWKHKLFRTNKLTYLYKNAPVTVQNSDGIIKVYPNSYRFALRDLFTPPRCWVCYDKINVFADIVFGDPWRMPDTDEKKGSSLIVTRTPLGSKIIEELSSKKMIVLSQRPSVQLLKGQIIDSRRDQVASYSKAINQIPVKIESYLYNQEENRPINSKYLKFAQKTIKEFIYLEKKPRNYIVKKAISVIRKENIKRKLHYNSIKLRIHKLIGK